MVAVISSFLSCICRSVRRRLEISSMREMLSEFTSFLINAVWLLIITLNLFSSSKSLSIFAFITSRSLLSNIPSSVLEADPIIFNSHRRFLLCVISWRCKLRSFSWVIRVCKVWISCSYGQLCVQYFIKDFMWSFNWWICYRYSMV